MLLVGKNDFRSSQNMEKLYIPSLVNNYTDNQNNETLEVRGYKVKYQKNLQNDYVKGKNEVAIEVQKDES